MNKFQHWLNGNIFVRWVETHPKTMIVLDAILVLALLWTDTAIAYLFIVAIAVGYAYRISVPSKASKGEEDGK